MFFNLVSKGGDTAQFPLRSHSHNSENSVNQMRWLKMSNWHAAMVLLLDNILDISAAPGGLKPYSDVAETAER